MVTPTPTLYTLASHTIILFTAVEPTSLQQVFFVDDLTPLHLYAPPLVRTRVAKVPTASKAPKVNTGVWSPLPLVIFLAEFQSLA